MVSEDLISLFWFIAAVSVVHKCHSLDYFKKPLSSFQLINRNFPVLGAAADTLFLPVVLKSSPRTTISNKSINWKPNGKLSVNTGPRGFFSAPTATSKFARLVFLKVTRNTRFQVDRLNLYIRLWEHSY